MSEMKACSPFFVAHSSAARAFKIHVQYWIMYKNIHSVHIKYVERTSSFEIYGF